MMTDHPGPDHQAMRRAVNLSHAVLVDMGLAEERSLPDDTMRLLHQADQRDLAIGLAYLAHVMHHMMTLAGVDPIAWAMDTELAQRSIEEN